MTDVLMYQEKYDELTKQINLEPHNLKNYFHRALIDYTYLKKHYRESLKDLKRVIKLDKDNYINASMILILLAYDNADYKTVLEHGFSLPLKLMPNVKNLEKVVNVIVSTLYHNANNIDEIFDVLKYIDYVLLSLDEQNIHVIEEVYILKIEILFMIGGHTEIENILFKFDQQTKHDIINTFWINLLLKRKNSTASDYQKALEKIEILKTKSNKPAQVDLFKGAAFLMLNNDVEADNYLLERIDGVDAVRCVETTRIYLLKQQTEKAKKVINNFLELNKSFEISRLEFIRVKYTEALLYYNFPKNIEDLYYCLDICLEIVNENNSEPPHELLIDCYISLDQYEKAVDHALSLIEKQPQNGRWYNFYANILQKMGRPTNEIVKQYKKSYKLNFLSELDYFEVILPLVGYQNKAYEKYPKIASHFLKNCIKHSSYTSLSILRLAIAYANGCYKIERNLELAKEIVAKMVDNVEKDCCTLTFFGNVATQIGENDKAYQYYEEAYQLNMSRFKPECNCGKGYYAHALFKGIGCKTDTLRAQSLIKEAIGEDQGKTDSVIIYLYSYFALSGVANFDKTQAKAYLLSTSILARYEITKYVYLISLTSDAQEKKKYSRELKNALKYDSAAAIEHYNNWDGTKVYYPFFSQF